MICLPILVEAFCHCVMLGKCCLTEWKWGNGREYQCLFVITVWHPALIFSFINLTGQLLSFQQTRMGKQIQSSPWNCLCTRPLVKWISASYYFQTFIRQCELAALIYFLVNIANKYVECPSSRTFLTYFYIMKLHLFFTVTCIKFCT